MVEDRAGGDINQLAEVAQSLLDAARSRAEIVNANSALRTSVPQYKVDLDTDKAQTLGIPITDVYNALQTFLGGLYVNDFNRFGRTWKVMMQGEPEYRESPEGINRFYVRTSHGDMVPLSTLVSIKPMAGPEVVYRYNRFRTARIIGQNGPGYSSGQAADAMERIARQNLPAGYGYEWTGTMFQQKLAQGKEGFIFGFAAVLVFPFLEALYESWSIPLAVVLGVLPLTIATGAGAASRRALGTAVFGGMIAATLLAVFIVPVLYVVIQRFAETRLGLPQATPSPSLGGVES